MKFLKQATNDNNHIPEFVDTTEKRKNYIRGFLDSRLCITFWAKGKNYGVTPEVRYPRAEVEHRKYPLLRSFANALQVEGLKPHIGFPRLYLHGPQNVRKLIINELITDPSKLEKLTRLYFDLEISKS